jgi:hypothetical protein
MQVAQDISRRLGDAAITEHSSLTPPSNITSPGPPVVDKSGLEPNAPPPVHSRLQSKWGLTPLALTVTVNSVILLAIGLMVTVFSNYA